MRRTYCLYRVSTKKQVVENLNSSKQDDIPMQKIVCTEFAKQNGWTIEKEFYEKGVSGFKVSADERDAIQDLKEAALNHEFDILLVYMFDRLGRRDDETPFVVEWFVKQGIEVWSAREGQQRFENQTDKLLNYIRYWQANGESQKTSERVKTRMAQLTAEGKFTGGAVPYGYKLIETGKYNRKGYAIRNLVIDESEAEVIKEIFDKTVHFGWGSYKIANMLNDRGLTTHKGAKFQSNTINRILHNRLYCGYFISKDVISPKQEYLALISEADWDAAQEILKQRKEKNNQKTAIAMNTRSSSLLSGNIFCGHCGSHLAASRTNYKYRVVNGTPEYESRRVYTCYHRTRRLTDCDGQSVYQAEKVEKAVLSIAKNYFGQITHTPKNELIKLKCKNCIVFDGERIRRSQVKLAELEERRKVLIDEISQSLLGQSTFTPDMLKTAIDKIDVEIEQNKKVIETCEQEIEDVKHKDAHIDEYYNQLVDWANKFDSVSLDEKKMILCNLFDRIVIKRGYEITTELKIVYKQFFE